MEYGGITPVGLPDGWRLFVDASLLEQAAVVMAAACVDPSFLPGPLLAQIPGAEVVEGLGR